jgi:hypothetical protein
MEKNKKEVEAKLLFWIISLRSMAMARRESSEGDTVR